MAMLLNAAIPDFQLKFTREYVPGYPRELAFLSPCFDTWPDLDGHWMGVWCDLPEELCALSGERILVRYRLGKRHQLLMLRNGQDWTLQRVGFLMRLLLRQLAKEVEKVRTNEKTQVF